MKHIHQRGLRPWPVACSGVGLRPFPNSKLAMQRGRVLLVDLIIEFLGWKDSNLRMAESKPAAVPLGDTPTSFLFSMNKIILQRNENIHLKNVRVEASSQGVFARARILSELSSCEAQAAEERTRGQTGQSRARLFPLQHWTCSIILGCLGLEPRTIRLKAE